VDTGKVRKAVIVGCGAVAESSYAQALKQVPNLRPAFACDVDRTAAERVAAMLGAQVADYAEALGRSDVVIIATPPASHFELARQAIAAGREILCEKPFVGTGEEARALVRESAERDVSIHVGHFRRCFPALRAARDLVGTGLLGRVAKLEVVEGGRFAWVSRSRYVERDPHGGVLFDTGSHGLDMALFAAGLDAVDLTVEVERVRRDRPEPSHELEADLSLLTGAVRIPVRIQLSRFRALANRVRISCEAGTVDVSTSPRDRFRVWGPLGSTVSYTGIRQPDFQTTFLEQLHRIFGPLTGGDEFAAQRFVNLTDILETVCLAPGEAL